MDRTVCSNILQHAKLHIAAVRSVLGLHNRSLYTQSLAYPLTNYLMQRLSTKNYSSSSCH